MIILSLEQLKYGPERSYFDYILRMHLTKMSDLNILTDSYRCIVAHSISNMNVNRCEKYTHACMWIVPSIALVIERLCCHLYFHPHPCHFNKSEQYMKLVWIPAGKLAAGGWAVNWSQTCTLNNKSQDLSWCQARQTHKLAIYLSQWTHTICLPSIC